MKDEYDFFTAERGRFYRPPTTLVAPTHQDVLGKETINFGDGVEAHVIRRPESWNFIYFALAFSIAIEGTILQMLTPRPLSSPWTLVTYGFLAAITGWLFIFNGRFRSWIFSIKQKYESLAR